MRRLAVALLALVLTTAACSGGGDDDGDTKAAPTPSSSAPAVPDGEVYTDRDGFTITYPSSWEPQTDVAGLQVVATVPGSGDATFRDNVGVLVEKTSRDDLTVKEYLDASVANAGKIIQQFHLVRRSVQEVDGVEQGVLEYTGTAAGHALHFLAVVETKGRSAFTATFTATPATFATGLVLARPVLESLRVT